MKCNVIWVIKAFITLIKNNSMEGVTDWNSFLWHFPTLRINHVNKLVSHYQNSPTMCNAEKRELNRLAPGPWLKIQSPSNPSQGSVESGYLSWSYCMSINTDMPPLRQPSWTAALVTFTTQKWCKNSCSTSGPPHRFTCLSVNVLQLYSETTCLSNNNHNI